MFQELVIRHIQKSKSRYLFLNRPSYRVGKALDNDIVLLDSECPSYLGMVEKKEHGYVWQPQGRYDGYTFQIRNSKRWLSALAFSGFFFLSLLFFQWMLQGELIATTSSKLPARGTYGNLGGSSPAGITRVEFEFEPVKNKHLTLRYTSGNLSKSNELQVEINGRFLSFAPASPGKWNIETQRFIPESLLNEKSNKVAFVFQGDKNQNWGVRDIYIEASKEIPSQQDGKDFLLTAKKLLRERSVKKGNLVRAQQVLDQAAQYYLARNEESPESLSQLIAQVQKEKYRLILDHLELVRKYQRQNENKKSRIVYDKLMDELIDPMDSDRIAVQKEFE